jgi:hypothetical protein
MKKSDAPSDRERLARVIEALGADQRRWPDDVSAAASARLAGDPALSASLAEAAALDRLLDRAAAEDARAPAPAALLDRIVQALPPTPADAAAEVDGRVVDLARHRGERRQPAAVSRRPAPAAEWRAAALLAASLLCGLYIGLAASGTQVGHSIAERLGLVGEADPGALVLSELSLAAGEEDAL